MVTESADPDTLRSIGLTVAEIECLRLVSAGVTTSKAIASRTGLSPGTVDTYLSRAAKALGAGSRKEAAARYLERLAEPIPSPSAPPVVSDTSQPGSQSRPDDLPSPARSGFSDLAAGARWLFSVPPISGPEHSFTWIEKTLAIVRIAAVSLSAVVILTMVGAGLLWVTG